MRTHAPRRSPESPADRGETRETPSFPDARHIAHEYLRAGWSVIPIAPRGKRPTVAWLEYQRRLPTVSEIDAWFTSSSDMNIGIVTGAISGLVVVDIDASRDGAASLRRLQQDHGPLPTTVEARTGGGGRHLYFRHPGDKIPNRVGLAPGIDIRADGGCVVAPPSLHATGHRYKWIPGHSPREVNLAILPSWLLTIIEAKS